MVNLLRFMWAVAVARISRSFSRSLSGYRPFLFLAPNGEPSKTFEIAISSHFFLLLQLFRDRLV